MKIGDYIEQPHTETIALVIKELKNGAYQVLAYDFTHRVKQLSTHHWYPEPHVIAKELVPQKVVDKINNYILRKAIYG